MPVPKYNKYSTFFDVLSDFKASFNLEKEQLYDVIEETKNNSMRGKTDFAGTVLEAPIESKIGGSTDQTAKSDSKEVQFAKIRLNDVEDFFVPDPYSVADPVKRKKIISQHKTGIFSPPEGGRKAILSPGDVVNCSFAINGPNDNGKLRGLTFSHDILESKAGNFIYSDSSEGGYNGQANFDASNPSLIGEVSPAQLSSSLGANQAKFYTSANRQPGDVKKIVLHSTAGSEKKGSAQRTIDRFARGPTISYTWKNKNTGEEIKNPKCDLVISVDGQIPHGTICHPTRKQVEKPVKTSIHWAVDKHGGLVQGLLEKDIGYHAGGSNRDSIGIEMCGKPNDKVGQGYQGKFAGMYNETILVNTAKLVAGICKRWNLTPSRTTIVGHYELDPARRSDPGNDPGEWDWDTFLNLVKQFL